MSRRRFGVDEALSRILDDSQEYESSGDEVLDGENDLDETDELILVIDHQFTETTQRPIPIDSP